MTTDRIWVLGAPDPEMEMIERLLVDAGERVEYATVWRDGARRRVTPAEAYAPDVEIGAGLRGLRATAYMVECAPAVLVGSAVDGIDWSGTAITIDHHRHGDPGYGRPPAEFLPASSIGQVISVLAKTGALRRAIPKEHEIARWMASHRDLPVAEYNKMLRTQWFWSRQEDMPGPDPYASYGTIARGVSFIYDGYAVAVHRNDFYFERQVALIPRPLIYAAAADHCLGAAYRGECPGVDPDALMRWRAESRARFQRRAVEDVLADVERAREAVRAAPTLQLAPGIEARDMRGRQVPELPEAAARDGVCFIASIPERDGRIKVVCQSGTPEQIEAFMRAWAPAQGLTDIYGDPARGFAGGYMASKGL